MSAQCQKKNFLQRETQDSQPSSLPASQTTLFQSKDGQYVDQSGNVVNLSAYGIDVTKGVEIWCVPETQQSTLSQNVADDDSNSQSLLLPLCPSSTNYVSTAIQPNIAPTSSQSNGQGFINILPRSDTPSAPASAAATEGSDNSVLFVGESNTSALPTFTTQKMKGKAEYTEEHVVDIVKEGDGKTTKFHMTVYYVVLKSDLGFLLHNILTGFKGKLSEVYLNTLLF